jgi:hypothetical protein
VNAVGWWAVLGYVAPKGLFLVVDRSVCLLARETPFFGPRPPLNPDQEG